MITLKKARTTSRISDVSNLLNLMNALFAEQDWSADTYLSPRLAQLSTLDQELSDAIKRLQTASQLETYDQERDHAVRALFKLTEGYTYHPTSAIQTAAETLTTVLEVYGLGIQHESYAAESAHLTSLLGDLKKDPLPAAIDQLDGIKTIITALTNAQETFNQIALTQAKETSEHKALVSASELKKQALTVINKQLVPYLKVMIAVNPATYQSTADAFAELIEANNERVKRRQQNPNEPENTTDEA